MPVTRARGKTALSTCPFDEKEQISSKKRHIVAPDESHSETFFLEGKEYYSYSEMVNAKRERNRKMLECSGLLETAALIRAEQSLKTSSRRGLSASKAESITTTTLPPRRKSSRLAGISSGDICIEHESNGKFVFNTSGQDQTATSETAANTEFYNGRVNDGSDLSVEQATSMCEHKWKTPLGAVQQFISNDLASLVTLDSPSPRKGEASATDDASLGLMTNMSRLLTRTISDIKSRITPPLKSTTSTTKLMKERIQALHADDENCVAKVTPERIYSVSCHPSSSALIVCAGDKRGYLGFWNVDRYSASASSFDNHESDGIHLFKPHAAPISNLQWNPLGSSLYSISYDNTVRKFDIQSQTFSEVFATFDRSARYKDMIGYGMDEGRHFWIQYGCLDPRQEESMFLSTSVGNVMHLDFRSDTVTFNKKLSGRKINTVSLHLNGITLATSGLDNAVCLWDIRKFCSSNNGNNNNTKHEALSILQFGRSVSSAFFSPSGSKLLCTTMANEINVVYDAHLQTGTINQNITRIRHDNMTGRWLSTFMAQWHPRAREDLFVVGSMSQPRRIEIFDGSSGSLIRGVQGNAMTAVSSRCCFHPSEDNLVVCGGNSSGRVVICR